MSLSTNLQHVLYLIEDVSVILAFLGVQVDTKPLHRVQDQGHAGEKTLVQLLQQFGIDLWIVLAYTIGLNMIRSSSA